MKDDRITIIFSWIVFLCFSVLSTYIKDPDKVTMRPDKKKCARKKRKIHLLKAVSDFCYESTSSLDSLTLN